MMETLIKLLAIKIVANKDFGRSNNSSIVFANFALSFSSASISPGFNEKNATSDPEINADATNNMISIKIEITTGKVSISN